MTGLATRSSTFVPLILLRYIGRQKKLIKFTILICLILLFYFVAQGTEVFTKYYAFGDALLDTSDFKLGNATSGAEYSAFKRVFYILNTIEDLSTFENYFTINQFEFREGFFLSLVSVNTTLGLLLLSYYIKLSVLFLRKRDYVVVLSIFAWLFILPVFDPLLVCLLMHRSQINQAGSK
jgi:hypothetical protein